MSIFDSARDKAEELLREHGDTVEQTSDTSLGRAAAEASERTGGQYDEHIDRVREAADSHVGIDGPGVDPASQAAAGPTQAETSGSGPAPAAGHSGAGVEGAGTSTGGVPTAMSVPDASDASDDEGHEGEGLAAEQYGIDPTGASADGAESGQDNGLNS